MPAYRYAAPEGNRYASSIADLIARQGEIAARRAEQVGNAQARAAEQSGQAWAGAVSNIGQTVAAIPGQMQEQKRQALRDEVTGIQARAAKREESDVNALDAAFKLQDRDAILNALPGHMRTKVAEQFATADKHALELKTARAKVDEANNKYLASLGASVADHDYDLFAAGIGLQHARNTYADDPAMVQRVDAIAQQLQSNPDSIKQVIDSIVALDPERVKLSQAATKETREATQGQARIDIAQQQADTAAARETRETTQGQKRLDIAQQQANAATTRAHAAVAANGDAITLSDEGKKAAALTYAKTGTLPPMGMGKAGAKVRAEIINLAADLYPNLDVASNKADYDANKASLTGLQKQFDAVSAFEHTALKNLDVFMDAAKKVPDWGSPLLNKPIRQIDEKALGSADMAAFNTARRTVIPEFAKILANPGLSGQLSDSARHEVEEVVAGNATLAQIKAAANVLKTDAANRRESYSQQIEGIKARISGKSDAPKPSDDRIRVIGPNGETGTVPAGTSLPAGWRKQ